MTAALAEQERKGRKKRKAIRKLAFAVFAVFCVLHSARADLEPFPLLCRLGSRCLPTFSRIRSPKTLHASGNGSSASRSQFSRPLPLPRTARFGRQSA